MSTRRISAARSAVAAPVRTAHVAGRAAITVPDGTDLTLVARIVPWNVAARVTDDGRTFYDETWTPGSLDTSGGRIVAYDGHIPAGGGPGVLNPNRIPVGRVDGFDSRADGMWGTVTLADTGRGREVYELARTLGYVGVSIETETDGTESGAVVRTAARPHPLTGIAIVLPPFSPAFEGAMAVTAGRADTPDPDPTPDPNNPDPDPDEPDPDQEAGRSRIAEIVRSEVARYGAGRGRRSAVAHPLGTFGSFESMTDAARTSAIDRPNGEPGHRVEVSRAFHAAYELHRTIERAARSAAGRVWVDQITSENPGVMPPAWLTEVFGIVDMGRPGISAVGGPQSAGDSGLDIYWPYLDPALDLKTVVAVQATEKTEIASVKVKFLRGSGTLKTFAGGSDVSYQLQRRSTPSYMALYDRVLQISYGMVTDKSFLDLLVASAGTTLVYDYTTDTDGKAFRSFLFAASLAVRNATGAPASAVLVASDVFAALGGISDFFPTAYGTANVGGTAQASTLSINVSGMTITEAPMMADGNIIVTNGLASGFPEDGPFLVTAEDVSKLGTDVAIWGLGTGAVFEPKGVVKASPTAPGEDQTSDDSGTATAPPRLTASSLPRPLRGVSAPR